MISDRLKSLRGNRTLIEFSKLVGVPVSTVRSYEQGRMPPADYIGVVANICNVSSDWILFGEESDSKLTPSKRQKTADVPLLGAVPAGPLSSAVEAPESTLTVPVLSAYEPVYALRVVGDSMKPTLIEGDVVLVSVEVPRDGQIAMIQTIGDYETTVKRVWVREERVVLMPDNVEEFDMVEVPTKEIVKLHRVVGYIRKMA